MTGTLFLVVTVIVTALFFDFTNGFHDSANAMATSVATGALAPRVAVSIAAVLNVIGAFLSTEVARTISAGMVNDAFVSPTMIFAGLVAAILWNLLTWLFGLPSSSSHALFGGLIGAVLVGAGLAGVNFSVVVSKILLPAVVAPVVAGIAAGLATRLVYRLMRRADENPAARWFRRAQTVSGSMIALAHGTSDGQKTMGVITLVLITGGYQAAGTGPQVWVVVAAGLAIGLGTYSGGWRIMRTMGKGLVDLHPLQGFAAETTSASAILASAQMGFGLSTTQVCAGSVMGSGAGPAGARPLADRRPDGVGLAVDPAVGGSFRRGGRRHRADRHAGRRRRAGRTGRREPGHPGVVPPQPGQPAQRHRRRHRDRGAAPDAPGPGPAVRRSADRRPDRLTVSDP
ncbi:MAG TPA: inorganic phosphate transporter [Nakamurella sp.]